MRRTRSWAVILVFLFGSVGCKTTGVNSSVQATDAATNACPKPVTVAYDVSSAGNAEAKKPAVALPHTVVVGIMDLLTIEVHPEDFTKLDSHDCKTDGTCTSIITKPVKVELDMPVNMLAKIGLTYEQKKGDAPGICLRSVKIGAKISPPLCLGKILKFTVALGLGVERDEDLMTHKVTYDAKPYCNTEFSCMIPFIIAKARMNKKGISFESGITTIPGLPASIGKVNVEPIEGPKVSWSKIPKTIVQLKDYFSSQASTDLPPDVYWENFVENCGFWGN